MNRVAVIMAGGSGERFWPLSRSNFPKQLLHITNEKESLLQESISRVIDLFGDENIYIATTEALMEPIRDGDRRIPTQNVLGEPAKRNTTGCLVWAAAHLMARTGDENLVMSILTADHRIGDNDLFRSTIDGATTLASKSDSIVTIGAKPVRPDTGYGYIELGEPVPNDHLKAFDVKRFREKPNQETAEHFMSEGNFLWNCGMFFWSLKTFFSELNHHAPEIGKIAEQIVAALKNQQPNEAIALFESLENISIDYALLEKSNQVVCIPAPFEWDDVGSWDSLERYRTPDANANVLEGNVVCHDAEECIVINKSARGNQVIGLIGLDNVVVVSTDDAVLVVAKDRVQDVKKIVAQLKEKNAPQL